MNKQEFISQLNISTHSHPLLQYIISMRINTFEVFHYGTNSFRITLINVANSTYKFYVEIFQNDIENLNSEKFFISIYMGVNFHCYEILDFDQSPISENEGNEEDLNLPLTANQLISSTIDVSNYYDSTINIV